MQNLINQRDQITKDIRLLRKDNTKLENMKRNRTRLMTNKQLISRNLDRIIELDRERDELKKQITRQKRIDAIVQRQEAEADDILDNLEREFRELARDREYSFTQTFDNERTFLKALQRIRRRYAGSNFILQTPSGNYITVNEQGVREIEESLRRGVDHEYSGYFSFRRNSNYTFSRYNAPVRRQQRREGGFFAYLHNTKNDFSKYQLFKKFNKGNYNNNCLYDALANFDDITKSQLNHIKSNVHNRKVAKSDLTKICNQMEIKLKLHQYKKDSSSTNTYTYGNRGNTYDIALFEEHYFTYERINVVIGDKTIKTSLQLFKYLFDNKKKYLTKISNYDLNEIGYNTETIDTLDYNKKQVIDYNVDYHDRINGKLSEKQQQFKQIEKVIYFADFECGVDEKQKHFPYQLGFESADKDNFQCLNYSEGLDLSEEMLRIICRTHSKNSDKKKFMIYFHNAKYDSCFFNFDKIYEIDPVIKNGVFYSMKFVYYYNNKKFNFEILDTFKHLSYPLSKFPKLFPDVYDNRFNKKEIMPYSLYTMENIDKEYVKIDEAVNHLRKYRYNCSENDIKDFLNNVKDLDITRKNKFDIIEYSRFYNEIDVKLLKLGFIEWRRQVLEFTGLDIYEVLTSASLAQKYFEQQGCYDDVNKINQIARKFIQNSVFGGRCMSRKNEKKILEGKIQDFDAVSLYPSAMRRLVDLGGILKGLPKALKEKQLNMKFLNKCDGYFVEVKIIDLMDRDFPLIPFKDKKGLHYNTDKLIGHTVTLGKIQLEDLINFCDCKFEIIRGYYFDEGRDSKICDVILDLFNKRLQYKAEENPLQAIVKLIMNSAYGKTIQKENDTSLKILANKEGKDGKNKYINYLDYNYDKIKQTNKLADSNKMMVETFCNVNDHYGMPHVGSEILAMSKRIMSEVMCLAEDNGINIYYQDTDSMHLYEKDVEKLAELFKIEYKRDLIGKQMGQFHCDFESKKLEKIIENKFLEKNKYAKINKQNKSEFKAFVKKNDYYIYSEKCYIVGKKTYIDVLKINNLCSEPDFHIRLKGIPKESIDHYITKKKISYETLFQRMYDGKEAEFDLTCEEQKPKFNIQHFCCDTKLSFDRLIKF